MWATLAAYLWFSGTPVAHALRVALTPFSWVFGAVVALRNRRYDQHQSLAPASPRGVPHTRIPAWSVGNLTVGGTGKTPVAAWCVAQLKARGAHPAIVMRGIGDDEWRVHGLLNPRVPVIVSADRAAGVITAQTRGADCAVLDDAFQHRRASRVVDMVLISADQWTGSVQLLPAGPFRESLSALRRATMVVVTAKAATAQQIEQVVAAVQAVAPALPLAVMRLVPGTLRLATSVRTGDGVHAPTPSSATGPREELLTHPPEWLSGRTIHVVSAIGDPMSFDAQLRQLGAVVRQTHHFSDHHEFTSHDTQRLARAAHDASDVICTLKDAVKLAPLWPRAAPPLWYLSQTVDVVRGAAALERACEQLLTARSSIRPPVGAADSNT